MRKRSPNPKRLLNVEVRAVARTFENTVLMLRSIAAFLTSLASSRKTSSLEKYAKEPALLAQRARNALRDLDAKITDGSATIGDQGQIVDLRKVLSNLAEQFDGLAAGGPDNWKS